MFERMLDKQNIPDFNDMYEYCNTCKKEFMELHNYIKRKYNLDDSIRFPYGKKYGWGLNYSVKKKHIFDVFPENNAFTVMIRLENVKLNELTDITSYTKECIDKKYPCNDGGWLFYRVSDVDHLNDAKKIIDKKLEKKTSHENI